MIGLIVGTALFGSDIFSKGKKKTVKTRYGTIEGFVVDNAFVLNRHFGNRPPHMINHRANIMAMKRSGVEYIISISSTGSLKKGIKPGSIVVPHDYINFNPVTFFDREIKHITPGLDEKLRKIVIKKIRGIGIKPLTKGVYFQFKGPRYETKAEIRAIAKIADLVGQTSASEATLAKELGIPYAMVCTVDNYANGISGTPTYEKMMETVRKNLERNERIASELIR
ncbi:MAG: MTAP family purine nucleoside phosphorylase [Candidatus Diapherotrites archaeon]|nr:MTAP family purine nucleoside phosphorylase [Candidatus Diapherotrites archaeon]